jgi:GAF domain-containing protein
MGLPIFAADYAEVNEDRVNKYGFSSFASVPLLAEEEVIGALNITTRRAHVFSEEEKALLQSIGRELGTVITKMKAEELMS